MCKFPSADGCNCEYDDGAPLPLSFIRDPRKFALELGFGDGQVTEFHKDSTAGLSVSDMLVVDQELAARGLELELDGDYWIVVEQEQEITRTGLLVSGPAYPDSDERRAARRAVTFSTDWGDELTVAEGC